MRSAMNRAGVLALLCLLAATAAPATAAAPKPGDWIELGGGSEGSYSWSIEAKTREGPTGEGPLGAQLPCLLADVSWQSGALEFHRSRYRQCAPPSPLSRSGPPLVASGAQPSTGAPVRMSAVGMIFAPGVHRVRVTFGGGRQETIALSKIDPAEAAASGVAGLRYAAFAIHGTWCAERLVSESASGKTLWDSGTDGYECGSEAAPHFVARPR